MGRVRTNAPLKRLSDNLIKYIATMDMEHHKTPVNLFGRLLIWQKFTLGFVIVGLFFLGIVFIYHVSMKQMGESYERLLNVESTRFTLGYRLSHVLAMMRDVEYNFLLDPNDDLPEEHQGYFEEFSEKLAELTALEKRSGHGQDLKVTQGILAQINVYRQAFLGMVNAWKVKGLEDQSGLRQQLVEATQRSETAFNSFDVDTIHFDLLRMQEHYLRFRLTGRKEQVAAFMEAAAAFLRHLEASNIEPDVKRNIAAKLKALTTLFQDHVQKKPKDRHAARIESALQELAIPIERNRITNIWRGFYQVRTHENAYLKTHKQRHADRLAQLIEVMRKSFENRTETAGQAMMADLATYRSAFLAMARQDRLIEARNEEMAEAVQTIEFLVAYHLGKVTKDMEQASEETRQFARARTRLAFIMATVLILLMILVAFLLVKSLVIPIAKVTHAMLHVANGNMDSQVPVMGRDELGQMAEIFNTMSNQLSAAHEGLQSEQEKLTTILLSAREGIVGTNRDGRIALVNPAALVLLGKTEEEIVAGGFLHLIDDPEYVKSFLDKAGADMPETLFYKGKVLQFFAATIEGKSGDIVGSAALIRDVTEEKKLEGMLRDLSNTDGLTQLLNRRRFDELMLSEYQRARRYGLELGLILFDVDHFKKFNDTYGHDQGDRVLQAIANTMKDSFRDVDFCCRYGGEEFCIITPNTGVTGLQVAAERLRKAVEDMVVDDLKVTITIGAIVYPTHFPGAKGPDELFKATDDALYVGKKAGRNQVCLVPTKEV